LQHVTPATHDGSQFTQPVRFSSLTAPDSAGERHRQDMLIPQFWKFLLKKNLLQWCGYCLVLVLLDGGYANREQAGGKIEKDLTGESKNVLLVEQATDCRGKFVDGATFMSIDIQFCQASVP
jgi:hypothetical protein